MKFIYNLVITGLILLTILMIFICGYGVGLTHQIIIKPAVYDSKQIDDLIKHDEVLTSIVAEQVLYEKSFTDRQEKTN